jgi:hypothetical protein
MEMDTSGYATLIVWNVMHVNLKSALHEERAGVWFIRLVPLAFSTLRETLRKSCLRVKFTYLTLQIFTDRIPEGLDVHFYAWGLKPSYELPADLQQGIWQPAKEHE